MLLSSSTIIEDLILHCKAERTAVVAFFYFDFNNTENQSYSNALRSIIAQISAQYPETPSTLSNLYRASGDGTTQPLDAALLSALQQMLGQLSSCYIVLDALDEAGNRQEVLDFIQHIVEWKLPGVHLLVTSRRETDIEATLDPLSTQHLQMQHTLISRDISEFVQHRLSQDQRLRKWPESVKDEIKITLANRADGM